MAEVAITVSENAENTEWWPQSMSRSFATRLMLVLAMILVVAACSTTPAPTRHTTTTGLTLKTAGPPSDESGPITDVSASSGDPGVTDIEIYQGSGEFINEDAAQRRPDVVSEDGEIVLNFEGESIQSVVHTILGEVLQESFVIAPGVGGAVDAHS